MTDQELAFTPAWRLRELIASRKVSPVELTELFLARIQQLDPGLNAYLTVAAEQALASARRAEAEVKPGANLGPLHGIPVAIKDLTSTGGIRTTRGSLIYKDFVPDVDEPVVARIRSAGAVILGKTNTPEFGFSATTENLLGDACRNPWNPERTPGGSSGGAGAAVAAGLAPTAQGSDGGGSIRIPCSMCGVYGIKPTFGRVARPYQGPGAWGPLAQNGPITRTVLDAAILLQVMAGHDPLDPTSIKEDPPDFSAVMNAGVRGLRVGWNPDLGGVPVDPEVRRVTAKAVQAFEELGAHVVEAEIPIDHLRLRDVFMTIFLSDYAASFGELLRTRGNEMSPFLREMLLDAVMWPASKLALALHELEWHRARMNTVMEQYDLLLTPTLATPPFPVGQRPSVIDGQDVDPVWAFTPFCFPFNLTGQPAASLPCGFSSEGLPIGLHLIGRLGDEATVLRASAAFEQARPWAQRRPVVS
ncbi:MAG: amidase [Dehalococcoidia bacterium]|nr:amidase [Dehalococcoidia bacterium]